MKGVLGVQGFSVALCLVHGTFVHYILIMGMGGVENQRGHTKKRLASDINLIKALLVNI